MNEWGIRPPLCIYRLNWATRTSWGWWDAYAMTLPATHDSRFEPGGLRPDTLHSVTRAISPWRSRGLALVTAWILYREGHSAMVRAWRSAVADVAACRGVSNPAWCRIFREISCFWPLILGTLLRCCVLGQGTSPSNASLESGENEYLVGKRWQCVR